MSTTVHVAQLRTAHFEFLAVGATRTEALDTMRAAWERHRRDYGGHPAPWTELVDWSSVDTTGGVAVSETEVGTLTVHHLAAGSALRDGEPLDLH